MNEHENLRDREVESSDEALMRFAQARLRQAESSVDPMTAVRLAAARRRALDAVPRSGWLGSWVSVGGALVAQRRTWLAAPGAALAALAIVMWQPWHGNMGGAAAKPSAETLEWLAQDAQAPVPADLYDDIDLVMWLADIDGSV